MTCEVCEHCEQFVFPNEESTLRNGYSYHKKCHKCYVCDETNLDKAEVFKGVIFCEGCAKRIFQGCSTARRAKNNGRIRRRRASNAERPRFHRSIIDRAIELSKLNTSSGHCDSQHMYCEAQHSQITPQVMSKKMSKHHRRKHSYAIGEHASSYIITDHKPRIKDAVNTFLMQSKKDLRIAGIGTSKEIANLPLRKKSEVQPATSHSNKNKPLTIRKSYTLSILHQASGSSKEAKTWSDSSFQTVDETERTFVFDRRIGSILRFPFDYFMQNIVHRSSRIAIGIKRKGDKDSCLHKLKHYFHDEIVQHQGRGTKVLYPTINDKKSHKLGWLKIPEELRHYQRHQKGHPSTYIGCKHFRASHSYRCMRKRVMQLAGPTKSELARFRNKIKRAVIPRPVIKFLNMNLNRSTEIKSTACGDHILSFNTKSV